MHITMADANTPEEKAAQKRLLEMVSAANLFIHACKEALLYGLPFPDPKATENLRAQLPVLVAVVARADVPNANGDVFPREMLEAFASKTPSMTNHVDAGLTEDGDLRVRR